MNSPVNKSDRLDPNSAAAENRFHTYVGNRIPWYVRLIWVCFWVFAVYYVITYLFNPP
jgi:hypothetical protein